MANQPANQWRGRCILSFDGGGIRGYASLLILESLMDKIRYIEQDQGQLRLLLEDAEDANEEPATSSFHPHVCTTLPNVFLPCHYFDLMIGSSTGGLIAIMLSRFRMSAERAIEQYRDLGGRIFGSPRRTHYRRLPPFFALRNKFSSSKFTTVVNGVCDAHGHAVRANCVFSAVPLAADTGGCKTVVLALGVNMDTQIQETKVLFRSYEATRINLHYPLNPGPACSLPVSMVARAITAAPTYFKPINIPDTMGNRWLFKDGGLRENNPIYEGSEEVRWVTGSRPDIAVSIGTCHQNRPFFTRATPGGFRDILNTRRARKSHGGNTNAAHTIMLSTGYILGDNYWRFDDNKDVRSQKWKNIKMDEWRDGRDGTLHKMQELIREYLADAAVQQHLTTCAKSLVKQRRIRLQNPDEWQSFAFHTWNYRTDGPSSPTM